MKVEVNLSEPLPQVVEFLRQSGEVVEVQVDYPWVPPTCTHCKALGHISRNCLLLPAQTQKDSSPGSEAQKRVAPKAAPKGKTYVPVGAGPPLIPAAHHSDHVAASSASISSAITDQLFAPPILPLHPLLLPKLHPPPPLFPLTPHQQNY